MRALRFLPAFVLAVSAVGGVFSASAQTQSQAESGVVIRERVVVGAAGAADDDVRTVQLVPGRLLVSCDRADCAAALADAAWIVEGRRPSGEPFEVRVPVAAASARDAQTWTGTCDDRPFTRYEWVLRPAAPAVPLGDVVGAVRVRASFGHPSWVADLQPGQAAGAASYARGAEAPFCAAGRQLRASAQLVSAPASAQRTTVEMFAEPEVARAHDLVRLFVRANGDDGTGPAPYPENQWNVRFRQPVLDTGSYNEDLYGGRFESWHRGGFRFRAFQLADSLDFQPRTVFYSYARSGLVQYVFDQPLPFTYDAGSTDVLTVPVEVTLSGLALGPTLDVAVRTAWFETTTTRASLSAGQSATLFSHATDALGRLDAGAVRLEDANTTIWGAFRVWAYPDGAGPAGELVNDRTGERDPYGVTASVADLASGAIRFEAYPAGPPARHAAGQARPRWRRTAPVARHPLPIPLEPWEWTGREGGRIGEPSAQRSGGMIVYLDVEAYGYLIYSGTELVVETGLAVTAEPDTLSAGDEATFTVEAPDMDPAASVTFSVPDLALGGFVVAPDTARQTTATVALSDVASVRFRAADTAPDSAASVTVTVEAGERSATVDLTVLPAVTVRLLRPNNLPVGEGYVMVSKVRPDRLLPQSSTFANETAQQEYRNEGEPDEAIHFDWDTYRPEITGLPDSLLTPEAAGRFGYLYEIVRDGRVVVSTSSSGERTRGGGPGDQRQASIGTATGGRVARALQFFRLVSNGTPEAGTPRSRCSEWSRQTTGAAYVSDPGSCNYDDNRYQVDDQTLLVRLGDRLRATVFVDRTDGQPADTLGHVELPVGQDGSADGPDAIREVALVWHDYVEDGPAGRRHTSDPALSAARMSEDWAQASIRFESAPTASAFRTSDLQTVVRIRSARRAAAAGWIDLELNQAGTVDSVRVNYPAGADARAVAERVRDALSAVVSQVGVMDGDSARTTAYAVVNRSLLREIRVSGISDTDIEASRLLDPLEFVPSGSQAVLVAGWGLGDDDYTTVDVFAVPRIAIQYGDPADRTLAFARINNPGPQMFVTAEVAVGNDNVDAHVLAHEVGHLLLDGPFPGSGGGSECESDQTDRHHPASFNLMFCVALDQGEWIGGPKRLTPGQHAHTRIESERLGSYGLLRRP